MNIITVNKIDKVHLEVVKDEMAVKGAPVIKAVYNDAYGAYIAFEGSHRIAAAKELGLTPIIAEIQFEDIVDVHNDFADKVSVRSLSDDLILLCTIYEFITNGASRANAGLIYTFD